MDEEVNKYTQKSIELARSGNYLDRIIDVYPAKLPPERPIPADIMESIQELYEQGKYRDIALLLLNLKDHPFPVEHPYASLLRHLRQEDRLEILDKNPRLLEELVSVIRELGVEGIIRGVKRPKDINRMLGYAFKSWIKKKFATRPFKVVNDPYELSTCDRYSICLYVDSDKKISEFAVKKLLLIERDDVMDHYRRLFRRDILVRVRDKYVIGEARFLSTPGGSQGRDLQNILGFIERSEEANTKDNIKLYGIAIVDGIVWFYKEYLDAIIKVAKGNRIVLSALLLKDFLLDIFNQPL
ncbi:MAG: hypothetical protein QW168_06405 [Sulfolobales archaeon]